MTIFERSIMSYEMLYENCWKLSLLWNET